MAGLTDFFENELQNLLFNNNNIANLGDATGVQASGTAGTLTIALHTADPTDTAANQSVNEATYPGYARQLINRNTGAGGWTIAGPTASNVSAIEFGVHSGGSPTSETVTHFSLGYDSGSPTDAIIYVGALNGGGLAVAAGVNPTFAAGQLQISVD